MGRIREVVRNSRGQVTAVTTDQTNATDFSGRRFGVRIYASSGITYHAEVKPEGKVQAKLTFYSPQNMDIADGDKYAFGDYSEEVFQAIVLGMQFNSDWTCDVTLQDYVPALYGDLSKPIPDFDTVITKPIESRWTISGKPIIVDVVTDESVLLQNGTTLIPRAMLAISHPTNIDPQADFTQTEYRLSGTDNWILTEKDSPLDMLNIFVQGVEEGKTYDFRIRYTSKIGLIGQYAYKNNVKIIGKTSPPPDVTGFTAAIESPAGVRLNWNPISVLDFSRFRISGAISLETTATTALVVTAKHTGLTEFSIVGVDVTGLTSRNPATASINILPPKNPAGFEADARNDGLYLTWEDCETTWPVQHYLITDKYLNTSSRELRTQTVISPRPVGNYIITVQAVDIYGNTSGIAPYTLTVGIPSAPEATTEINNGVVRITWKPVSSSFPIKTYQVYSVDGRLLQETNSTFYDVDGPAGLLEFRIRAVDSAGNYSDFTEAVLELKAPEPPVVKAALNRNRDGLDLTWTVPSSMLPVKTYDIVRQWEDGLELKEEDYGSTDATAMSIPPMAAGLQYFMVRAVDASGNRSVWGECQLNVRAPGAAFITDVNVIDNNIQIYWNEPLSLFFDIAYYNFGTVEYGLFSLIGRIDARFASVVEKVAGEYSYQICPVDVAGNIGECSRITATVAQPPDFVLFNDYNSLFNGEIVNGVLDGNGGMLIPVDGNQTWNENIEKTAKLLQTSPETLTWKQKIDGSYTSWLSPMVSPDVVGTYTEIVDVGTVIPATTITVSITSDVMEGGPQIKCKIETSLTGEDDWVVVSEDALVTFATEFRYVRYTFTVYGGMLSILNINYHLAMKRLSDFGSVDSKATDNGEGFVSVDETPDLYGTWVPFITGFSDVQSGPIVACNEVGKTAYMNFKDVLKPEGFRVYVLDNEGNRVDGRVSWSAYGV